MSFQFKQFFIEDSDCAMKVGTDAIILGSWSQAHHQQSILDIGCGSGILALMLAQKSLYGGTKNGIAQSHIDAVELDASAAKQAHHNVEISPFANLVSVHQQDIRYFVKNKPAYYDHIISNPPYFGPGQSFDSQRQLARHTGEFTWSDLLHVVSLSLKDSGVFECVLPYANSLDFVNLAKSHQLFLHEQLRVKSVERKNTIRVLLRFFKHAEHAPNQAKFELNIKDDELVIHQKDGQYSQAMKMLCRDFYLAF